MSKTLIVNSLARRTIFDEAKREGIEPADYTRMVGGAKVIDWDALVEAIEQKRSGSKS